MEYLVFYIVIAQDIARYSILIFVLINVDSDNNWGNVIKLSQHNFEK